MPDDISRSLDHRIREHAIYGTLSPTVAFSALSPSNHCWFAELVCIAYANKVIRGAGTCSLDGLLLLTHLADVDRNA